jgi:hypothetical protein
LVHLATLFGWGKSQCRAFKIRFGTGEVVGLNNVGDLLALIEKKLSH